MKKLDCAVIGFGVSCVLACWMLSNDVSGQLQEIKRERTATVRETAEPCPDVVYAILGDRVAPAGDTAVIDVWVKSLAEPLACAHVNVKSTGTVRGLVIDPDGKWDAGEAFQSGTVTDQGIESLGACTVTGLEAWTRLATVEVEAGTVTLAENPQFLTSVRGRLASRTVVDYATPWRIVEECE